MMLGARKRGKRQRREWRGAEEGDTHCSLAREEFVLRAAASSFAPARPILFWCSLPSHTQPEEAYVVV